MRRRNVCRAAGVQRRESGGLKVFSRSEHEHPHSDRRYGPRRQYESPYLKGFPLSNHEAPTARVEVPTVNMAALGRQASGSDALQSLMRVVSKRRKWIVGSIVACEVLALAVTLLMRPTYQATATIELNKQGSGIDLGLGEALSSSFIGGNEALLTDLQTETAILQGDSLALDVIEQLKLESQPPFAIKGKVPDDEKAEVGLPLETAPNRRTRLLEIFRGHLRVVPQRGTRLIQVSFQSHDQNQSAEVANQLVEAYKSNYRQTHYEATTETSGWLTTQLTDLKTNVEEAEKKLTDFEKANGILSFNMATPNTGLGKEQMGAGGGYSSAEIHSPIIQKLDELNQELTQAEALRIGKEAVYRLTQTGNADVIAGLQTDSLAVQSQSRVLTQGGGLSNLLLLRGQQSQLKVEYAEASTSYGANNRHLKDLEVQIKSLDDQINQELQLITRRALADYQLAQQTEDAIHKQFDQQQAAASKLNDVAIQFAVLSDEAMSHKLLYEDLYTKLQEANISAGIKATNITVVSPARTESIPVRPKPLIYLALGILVGIFLGLATAYTVDSLDRTVSTPEEMEEVTGRPVIGIIPDLMKSGRSYGAYFRRTLSKPQTEESASTLQVWMLAHPESVAAEAFLAAHVHHAFACGRRGKDHPDHKLRSGRRQDNHHLQPRCGLCPAQQESNHRRGGHAPAAHDARDGSAQRHRAQQCAHGNGIHRGRHRPQRATADARHSARRSTAAQPLRVARFQRICRAAQETAREL